MRDLFSYSEGKRDTSIEAHDKKIKPTKADIHRTIKGALHFGNLSPDEFADQYDYDILYIRPRFTELFNDGQILDTGERRKNAKGNNCRVYKLKD